MSRSRSTIIHPYAAKLHLATTPQQWAALQRRFRGALETDPDSVGSVNRIIDTEDSNRAHLVVWVDVIALGNARGGLMCVVHESVHVAGMLLDHIGQPYDGESEALAYLAEWVASWLLDGIAHYYDAAGDLIESED